MADVGKQQAHSAPEEETTAWAWLVFLASFTVYAVTSSPAIGWLDSPEFVAQAATLGVAHSPGHPLPALLGRAVGLVPIGDLVWRVNIASALCAAGAVALLFASMRRVLVAVAPRMGSASSRVIAASLALVAAACWALWSNAVRAEVYALQSLLSVGALYALIRFEESNHSRWVLLATFFLALGLANHHLLALTIVLPALLFVLIRPQRPQRATYLQSVSIGALGLGALLYLPVRSLAHPLVNFGAPHTLDRFVWTLRGAAFSKSANLEHASTPVIDALQIAIALGEALTIPLLALAAYGIFAGRHAAKRLIYFLTGVIVVCAGARVLLGFDPETPDHHAYLLPAIFALYLLAAIGTARLIALALSAKQPLPKAPALAAVAFALLVPIQVALQWNASSQQAAWASDDMAHWEMDALPPRTVALQAYFQTTFRIWALQSVEGYRPDVAFLDRSFLSYPGMRAETIRQHPELRTLLESPLVAGAPTPIAMLQELDSRRPVRVQLHPNVDAPFARALAPAGAWASFAADEEADTRMRAHLVRLFTSAAPAERSHVLGALLWHDATRLDELCIIGKRQWANRVLQDALLLAPNDQMLAAMADRCGLRPHPQ